MSDNKLYNGFGGKNTDFLVGDSVKTKEGPFASFSGIVKEIFVEKEKLSVEIKIFECTTPVEVTFSQVEKIESNKDLAQL